MHTMFMTLTVRRHIKWHHQSIYYFLCVNDGVLFVESGYFYSLIKKSIPTSVCNVVISASGVTQIDNIRIVLFITHHKRCNSARVRDIFLAPVPADSQRRSLTPRQPPCPEL